MRLHGQKVHKAQSVLETKKDGFVTLSGRVKQRDIARGTVNEQALSGRLQFEELETQKLQCRHGDTEFTFLRLILDTCSRISNVQQS